MPPVSAFGDVRWVVSPGEAVVCGRVSLLYSAGGGVMSCSYPDLKVRLVRTTNRLHSARDPGTGVAYDRVQPVLVLTVELVTALTLALDQEGALWVADDLGLVEVFTADVQVRMMGPPSVAAPLAFSLVVASESTPAPLGATHGLRAAVFTVRNFLLTV